MSAPVGIMSESHDNPRVDHRGVLLVDPAEADIKEAEWFGEPCGEEMKEVEPESGNVSVTTFESVRIGDDIVSVGDSIYFTAETKGDPCEMGRVVAMFEVTNSGEKYFSVQWFWRPEHITMPRTMLHHKTREVFLSVLGREEQVDTMPINEFESKCTVIQLRETDDASAIVHKPHSFFYRRIYDAVSLSFKIAKGSEPRANQAVLQLRAPPEVVLTNTVHSDPPAKPSAAPVPSAPPARSAAAVEDEAGDGGAYKALGEGPDVDMEEEAEPPPPPPPSNAPAAASNAAGAARARVPVEPEPAPAASAAPKDVAPAPALPPAPLPPPPPPPPPAPAPAPAPAPEPEAAPAPATTAKAASSRKRKGSDAGSGPVSKARSSGSGGRDGGDTGGGVSGRLAVRRLQEHIRKVKSEVRDVQRELMRMEKVALRDVLKVIDSAREKHANLIKGIDALDAQVTTVANMALEGLGDATAGGIDGSADAHAVVAEADDDAEINEE